MKSTFGVLVYGKGANNMSSTELSMRKAVTMRQLKVLRRATELELTGNPGSLENLGQEEAFRALKASWTSGNKK